MSRTINVLKISGFQLSVDYTWFIVFCLLTWNLAAGYFPHAYPDFSTSTHWIAGSIASLMLFTSVLLHELAHSIVARKNGIQIDGITLFFFGGIAQLRREPPDPLTEFKVAIAGPICSISLGLIFLVLSFPIDLLWGGGILLGLFRYLATINIALALFNLFPGFPLDGGRILRAYLWDQRKDPNRATYIASTVGKMFAISLIVMGIYLTFLGNIIGLWWIFIGLFLRQSAESSFQQVLLKENLAGLRVSDLMTVDVVTMKPETTVEEAVNDFFIRRHFSSFPVAQRGELLGTVSLKEIKVIPKEEWPIKQVVEIMTCVSDEITLHPDTQAVDALRKMIVEKRGCIPVTIGHHLVGLLTRRDIMDLLRIKTDLAR